MSYEIKVNQHGFFEIHFLEGTRAKRKSLRTKNPKIAYARAAHYLEQAEVEDRNQLDPDVEYIIDYYMTHRGPEVTDTERLVYINRNILKFFSRYRPRQITPDIVRRYTERRESGEIGRGRGFSVSTGTIRRELVHLVTCINYAAKNNLLKREHVPYIQLPEAPPPKDRWLSEAEIQRVSELAKESGNERVELFFHIALRTAARKTSILELRWDQVDFERGLIDFGKHDVRVRRQKRRATVPISDRLMEVLKSAHEKRKNDYVLGHDGNIRTAFDNLMARAGIPEVTPHTLRHTWATHASMSGVPMNEIARVLGDTVSTVERVYAKWAPGYLKGAVNAVGF
jgi:integrase